VVELYCLFLFKGVNGFNVDYGRFIIMYNSGCQICCNWSRLKPGFGF